MVEAALMQCCAKLLYGLLSYCFGPMRALQLNTLLSHSMRICEVSIYQLTVNGVLNLIQEMLFDEHTGLVSDLP